MRLESCKESNRGYPRWGDLSWLVPHGNVRPLQVLLLPVLPVSAGTEGYGAELGAGRGGGGGEEHTSGRVCTEAARTTS